MLKIEAASYSETSVTIETIQTATDCRRLAGEKRVNFRQKGGGLSSEFICGFAHTHLLLLSYFFLGGGGL